MKPHYYVLISLLCLSTLSCDWSERAPNPPMELFDQAVAALQQHETAKARQLFEQAVADLTKSGNEEKQAIARTYLAQVHLELREFRSAFENLRLANALYTKLGDTRSGIRLSAIEGDIQAVIGRYREAVECFEAAADAATAFDDRASVMRSELGIARCFLAGGDADVALEHFHAAGSQAQSSGDAEATALALLGEGRAYRALQKWPEALNALTDGEQAIAGEPRPALTAELQAEIALVRLAQGNAAAAVSGLRDAINVLRRERIAREHEPVLLGILGSIYERTGRAGEAIAFYTEAAAVARLNGDRIAELYLTSAALRMKTAQMLREQVNGTPSAQEQWKGTAQQFRDLACSSGEAFVYIQMGLQAEQAGNLAEAQDLLARGITIDQRSAKEFFDPERHAPLRAILGILPPHQEWYAALARVLVLRNRPVEALRVTEMGRLRELREGFANAEVTLRQPGLKKQAEDVRAIVDGTELLSVELSGRLGHTDLAPTAEEASAMRKELERNLQRIRTGSIGISSSFPNYDLVVPGPAPDMNVVQRAVPRGSTVLSYLPTSDRLHIFALSGRALIVRSAPVGRDTLKALIAEYRRLLVDPRVYSSDAAAANVEAMTRFAALSLRLYDLLIRPAEDVLERNLIIIPDDLLDGFPVHALEQEDKAGNVKYLIELSGVDYLPSLSALRYRVQSPIHAKEIAAFGNPTGKNWAVDYELRDLRNFYRDARICVGLETAWANLKTTSADVLQIVTEYVGQTRTSPLGAILLSNGLTVETTTRIRFEKLSEMSGIPIVVLSNQGGQGTGLGRIHGALLRMNGTSDVILNAWSADRRAAKFFSEYFFTHLSNGLAPGDAYRQALLSLIRSRDVSHQRAWGQYFHYGIG